MVKGAAFEPGRAETLTTHPKTQGLTSGSLIGCMVTAWLLTIKINSSIDLIWLNFPASNILVLVSCLRVEKISEINGGLRRNS